MHFLKMLLMTRADTKERAQFSGLMKKMECDVTLRNLALMYDALEELGDLSNAIQSSSITLPQANRLIGRQIEVFKSRKINAGEKYKEAVAATSIGFFREIKLTNGSLREAEINCGQFYQSLSDSLYARLMPERDKPFCDALSLLLPTAWPEVVLPEYGESELKSVCKRVRVSYDGNLKNAYRLFKDSQGMHKIAEMQCLLNAIETVPCSTAECERGFSLMNIMCSDIRSSLAVSHMSSLMFVSLVGPPFDMFKPDDYTRSWLAKGRRDATVLACPARVIKPTEVKVWKQIWDLL